MIPHDTQRGFLLVLVLVFGSIFLVLLLSLVGFVGSQYNLQNLRNNQDRALLIAEAGINYYKWFLAHNPDDITNGTGAPGPYVHDYLNAAGEKIGEYSLAVSAQEYCGQISSIDIESTGYTTEDPDVQRTIYARYARPNVAEYSYIIDDSVWAGDDRNVLGPYHSNSYIRMDGTNNSIVTSNQLDWQCDNDVLRCNPPYSTGQTLDAVFGAGPNSDLWQVGAPYVDFAGITPNLGTMLSAAQTDGRYWGQSGARGYHIIFQGAGNTFELRRVNSLTGTDIINSETPLGTFSIPTACPLIFVEDNLWIDGAINTRVAVAAARPTSSVDPDVIIDGNLTYASDAGGLLLIGENDVGIGEDVPDIMEVNGIFVAQNGKFGRDNYSGTHRCKEELTINGTIVSDGRVGTKWVGGWNYCFVDGEFYSGGFGRRINTFDRKLVEDPPPITPVTSATYRFIEWREIE